MQKLPVIVRFAPLLAALTLFQPAPAAENALTFDAAREMLDTYCVACHQGEGAVAGFDVSGVKSAGSIAEAPQKWHSAMIRVRDGEMPPKGAPEMTLDQREDFARWVDATLKSAACAQGVSPGPAPVRRLNRDEYAATIRDLLNIHFNAGHALPADGAGGEGFDNAAETLFLSPMHAEKYLEAAKQSLEYGLSDPRSRKTFVAAEPDETISPERAARRVIEAFLPRAFRRPARAGEAERYFALFLDAQEDGKGFDEAIAYALQGVLVSPHFLFRLEASNPHPEPRLADGFAMASRLSYFLWGTMPDDELFCLADSGELQDPRMLDRQVKRMLRDVKARDFAERFTEQWLGTRELGRDIRPDPELFPEFYDAEVRAAIRYEPILFFQEIFRTNDSVLAFLDSEFTFLTNKLQPLYGLEEIGKLRQQPRRECLPVGDPRGGLLGMAAVLAVSSYPHRTSPVLRGKWVLETILGTPPPPPPPDVPELEEAHEGETPRTLRERLEKHRESPTCASCHDRIDPIGFGLENYDVLGRWRTEDGEKPIDSRGELPDGTIFEGPEELKAVLLERKDLFVRNLTSKSLGYGLGRGLRIEDYCTVEQIVERVEQDGYRAQTLIREIVRSVPFRYRPGSESGLGVPAEQLSQENMP